MMTVPLPLHSAVKTQPAQHPLEPWYCSGKLKDGRACRKVLLELDPTLPCRLRKRCERCGAWNTRER